MIKYKLECECGKQFDSWFSNSNEYEHLSKKKLVNCICGESNLVKKTIMGPNLTSKSNKISKKNKLEKDIKKKTFKFSKIYRKKLHLCG